MAKETEKNTTKEILNMDMESTIVYTRKLEDMKIFKKDLSKIRPHDIIESIISESKPLCKSISLIENKKMCKTKYDIGIHPNSSPVVVINSRFQTLQSILQEIKINSNNSDTNSALCIKSEIETDTCSRNKLESLLAMCKPLKIVLKDISKIVPKPKVKDEIEVLNISSDSDDNVITIGEEKIIDKPNTNTKSVTSTGISILSPVTNHMIENVCDLQKVLLEKELRKCCVVIYNLYTKELESYQIGESYNVTGYKSRKYSKVYKFPIKKCKFVVNVIACCWKKRQSCVSLLLQSKKYCDIARFISSSHPCKHNCTCCCDYEEQFFAEAQCDDESAKSDTSTTNSLIERNPVSLMGKSNLITTALTFETKKKWKRYPIERRNLNEKNKHNKCCKRLLKCNNTQGEVELYELGREDIIYSKQVSSTDDESSWLFKTVNQCRFFTDLTSTNPADREKKKSYKRLNNALSFHTKCFLGNPLKIKTKKKSTNSSENSLANRYKIEHTRSLISNNNSQTVSIQQEVHKTNLNSQPVYVVPAKSSPVRSRSKPKTPKNLKPVLPAEMDQEVSQNINSLIKNILHRFRDVFLTINSEGRVSAALNAPLTSLTPSELKILSEILNHAQSQVDKLGLSPGTCLTPLGMPSASDNCTSKTNATTSESNNKQTKQTCSTNNKQTKQTCTKNNKQIEQTYTHESSDFLDNSSLLIASKKYSYKQSFCKYLGDKLVAAPKITDLFSSKNVNYTSSNILKNLLEEESLMIEDDDGSVTNNVYENKLDVPITSEKQTQTKRPNKRKISVKDNGRLPKIRVKTAAEILVENSSPVAISDSPHLVQCDPTPSPADQYYVFNIVNEESNNGETLPILKFL